MSIKHIYIKIDVEGNFYEYNYDNIEKFCYFCNFNFNNDPAIKNNTSINKDEFINAHTLEEHLLEINDTDLKCLKCKITFSNLDDIQNHFFTDQHQNKTCLNCGYQLNTIKEYAKHVEFCRSKNNIEDLEKEIYTCIFCDLRIEGFERLVAHYQENHTDEKSCIICNKYSHVFVKRHLFHHRPKRLQFVCYQCMECCQSKKELLHHRKTVDHLERTCNVCLETVRGRLDLHHETYHRNKIICEMCGQAVSNLSNLRRHKKAVHFGLRFYCEKCPYSSSVLFYLNQHITEKHQIPIAPSKRKCKKKTIISYYECPICSKKFNQSDKRRIRMHKILHERGDKLKCPILGCDYTFPDNGNRMEHLEAVHEKFTCNQCPREFYSYDDYQKHYFIHTWRSTEEDLKNKDKICKICKETFFDILQLSNHVKKQYNLLLCPVPGCGEISSTSISAYQHRKKGIHGQELYRFPCESCDEKFKSRRLLLLHAKQHDTSRLFSCKDCGSLFKTASQLKRHSLRHTGEKPFVCKFCSKAFNTDTGWKGHERIHTGEKPFSCKYCGKRFTDGSYCKRHVLKHEEDMKKLQEEDMD